jgi:hypothetical protein
MDRLRGTNIQQKLAEIERLLTEFKEKFEAGTSDVEDFITMSEIERLWGELQSNTNNIYSDTVRELMSSVDESLMIRKKKESIGIGESNSEPTKRTKRQ